MSEGGQNTHGKAEQVNIPLLPNNVGKKIVNSGQGHDILVFDARLFE